MTHTPTVTLYLDVDGVLNFQGFPNSDTMFGGVRQQKVSPCDGMTVSLQWSSELVRKLGDLPVEVVWLSTWCSAVDVLESTLGYQAHRFLTFPYHKGIAGKESALTRDVEQHQRAFVWVDDDMVSSVDSVVRHIPHTTVCPSPLTGITRDDYHHIAQFTRDHS